MKLTLYLAILTLIVTGESYVQNNLKNELLWKRSYDYQPRFGVKSNKRVINDENIKNINLLHKAKKLKEYSKKQYQKTIDHETKPYNRAIYELDPVLNFLRRNNYRRKEKDSSSDTSSSSSLELREWKDEWKDHWINKKFEAVNSSNTNTDVVNMVAAKPWGVACGDPGQHDMPWGSCMLAAECESEYRIYRGDYFCGRTRFVCCALQLTNYDMYQGFDVSFEDSALSTDSEEKRNRGKGSKNRNKKKRRREKKRKKRNRLRRKRKLKKNIKKIIREIRKILNRMYKNATTAKKKKTKQLKSFIKDMKKKYKNDRQAIKSIHEDNFVHMDTALQEKLNQIRDVNTEFLKNSTFRDIILSGMMSRQGARMLLEAYPDLSPYLVDKTRRSIASKDHLDYDIEYGMLYY